MKSRNWIREYFSFTLKERIGIVCLVVIAFTVFVLPRYLPSTQRRLSEEEKNALRSYSQIEKVKEDKNDDTGFVGQSFRLFYFDPNTASEEEWSRLGLKSKNIRTIKNYLSKGGHFYRPGDLSKIYGIESATVERLIPYVRLPTQPREEKRYNDKSFENRYQNFSKWHRHRNDGNGEHYAQQSRKARVIDINRADSAEFESLPGIGSKLASRIVHFRERLGGFYDVKQVAETYGLPDSTFRLIEALLTISGENITRININEPDVYKLKSHPYIGWSIANALVKYRSQHGDFKSVEEIREVAAISPASVIKLLPYLSVTN